MTIDYSSAQKILAGRQKRKIGNNTYLEQIDEVFIVRLHNTDIIKIYPNNTQAISSGGWQTSTTKNRINEYSFASISQQKGTWFLRNGEKFFDGMIVDSDGQIVS